jgi:hypothetical protein
MLAQLANVFNNVISENVTGLSTRFPLYARIKTGVLSRIPLLPIAKLILDKYKGGEKLLPIQDPADINKYLKDIAILCDIKKRNTFHTRKHHTISI